MTTIKWFILSRIARALVWTFGIYDTFDAVSEHAPWMQDNMPAE